MLLSPLKKVLLASVVTVVIIIGFSVWMLIDRSTRFQIVSIKPGEDSISWLSPYIEVIFNRDIKQSSITVDSSLGVVGSFEIKGPSIRIYFSVSNLTLTEQTITVSNIESVDGDIIDKYILTFTPKNNSVDDPDANSYLLDKQKEAEADNYGPPLVEGLPFLDNKFSIEYDHIVNTVSPYISIEVYLYIGSVTDAQQFSEKEIQARQAADKYLTDVVFKKPLSEIDSEYYRIVYQTQ